MECNSLIMKNEILSFTIKWTELENIMLSEVSQVQKVKGCMLYVDDRSNKNTSIIIYTHKYYKICFQKWDCYRRLREEEKNGKE
jgi:hypothetical protein